MTQYWTGTAVERTVHIDAQTDAMCLVLRGEGWGEITNLRSVALWGTIRAHFDAITPPMTARVEFKIGDILIRCMMDGTRIRIATNEDNEIDAGWHDTWYDTISDLAWNCELPSDDDDKTLTALLAMRNAAKRDDA